MSVAGRVQSTASTHCAMVAPSFASVWKYHLPPHHLFKNGRVSEGFSFWEQDAEIKVAELRTRMCSDDVGGSCLRPAEAAACGPCNSTPQPEELSLASSRRKRWSHCIRRAFRSRPHWGRGFAGSTSAWPCRRLARAFAPQARS